MMKWLLPWGGMLLASLPGWAGEDWGLGSTVELPEAGMRFTPPKALPMLPVMRPDQHRLRSRDGAETVDVVEADAWWRYRQTRALFTNEIGRLVVATAESLRPPTEGLILGRYLRVEDLDALGQSDPWNNDTLGQWIEAFTGMEAGTPSSVHKAWSMKIPCRRYASPSADTRRTERFLLRLTEKGQARYVLLWFSVDRPDAVDNLDAALARCVRSVVPGTTRRASTRTAGAEKPPAGSVRERVLAEAASMDAWRVTELPHYLLVTDLDPNNRHLLHDLQARLEQLRQTFVTVWPPRQAVREVSVVRVFAQRDPYLRYVGPDYAWTAGIWMPGKEELVVSASGSGSTTVKRGKEREAILNTTYHEALHQYAHFALGDVQLPLWFNEGHASLFESVRFNRSGKGLEVRENDERLHALQYAYPTAPPLDVLSFMHTTPEEFYAAGEAGDEAMRKRAYHYGAAWAVVYFLRKAGPALYPQAGYHTMCDAMLDHMAEHPREPLAAVDHGLGGVDTARLQMDFEAFWDSKSKRAKAESFAWP